MLQIGYYLRRMAGAALIGVLLWGSFYPWRRSRRHAKAVQAGVFREGALLLLFMFLAGLLLLTLTPPKGAAYSGPFRGSVNLIPVTESVKLFQFYLRNRMWAAIWINFPGNIIMFMPIGFFAGLLSDKPNWWKGALWTFALSLFIETAQLFACRGTDIDDLILNTFGGLAGYWCFLLFRLVLPDVVRKCTKQQRRSA